MMSLVATLRHHDAKTLVRAVSDYTSEQRSQAIKKQEEILYNGNPALFGTCIICGVKADYRGDHFVSAIIDKRPRFRNNRLLEINHPLNMVLCCKNSQCNNEKKKQALIKMNESYKKYYEYVLENCPTMNISLDQYMEHDAYTYKMMEMRKARLDYLIKKSKCIYVEDIDD